MRKLLWLLGIIALLGVIGVGWYVVTGLTEMTEKKIEKMVEKPVTPSITTSKEKTDVAKDNKAYINPFGDLKKLEDLTDGDYQNYIHKMSHQKVRADVKWGFYEITSERIYWLLEGLDQVKLEHREIYRDILERWVNDDFSQVDKDHNSIWRLQGGTIGEATGILSPEEEEEYIKSQK